jgi:hypothetical protein
MSEPYVVPGRLEKRIVRWPLARTEGTAEMLFDDPACRVKLLSEITDGDRCQRGPDGKPLPRWTPLESCMTLAEWQAWVDRVAKAHETLACGHGAYRNHSDLCIQPGCPNAAYKSPEEFAAAEAARGGA